jgi:hypothetical protein
MTKPMPVRQRQVEPRRWGRDRRLLEVAAVVREADPEKMRRALDLLLTFLVVAADRPSARGRAGMSLEGVLRFLARFPELDSSLGEPLYQLQIALLSLDHGATEPILARKPSAGRPMPITWLMFRGQAAAAAELAKRSGLSLPDACAFVAKRLNETGYSLPGRTDRSTITRRTVLAWRREAMQGKPVVRAAIRPLPAIGGCRGIRPNGRRRWDPCGATGDLPKKCRKPPCLVHRGSP